MNTLFIPIDQRPSFLYWCLESVKKCRGLDDFNLLISADENYDERNDEILERQLSEIDYRFEVWNNPSLITNLSEGMKLANEMSDDFFIFLEEDLRVSQDFLEWHTFVQNNFVDENIFSSDPLSFYFSKSPSQEEIKEVRIRKFYGCKGPSFSKDTFEKLIEPHFRSEWYNNPRNYLSEHFPDPQNRFPWYRHGGLLQRIRHFSERKRVLFPRMPRCQDFGYISTRTGKNPKDDQTIKEVEKSIRTGENLKNQTCFVKMKDDHVWDKLELNENEIFDRRS